MEWSCLPCDALYASKNQNIIKIHCVEDGNTLTVTATVSTKKIFICHSKIGLFGCEQ